MIELSKDRTNTRRAGSIRSQRDVTFPRILSRENEIWVPMVDAQRVVDALLDARARITELEQLEAMLPLP